MPRAPKNLYRRGDTWYLRVNVAGRRIREPLSTNLEEANRLKKLRLMELKGAQGSTWERKRTFDDCADTWLAEKAATTRCEKARLEAERWLRNHVRPVLGVIARDDLRSSHLWALRANLSRSLKPESVATVMSLVRAVLSHERIWDRLKDRGLVPVPKLQAPDRLTDAEVRAVLERSGKWRPFVELSLLTGIRWGELAALTWKAFHRKPYPHLLLAKTKSGKVRRVPLSAEALGIVEQLLERKAVSLWIVPYRITAAPRIRVEGFHWHRLRHTFACRWVEAGKSLSALQKILGHADIRMTLRYSEPSDASVYQEAAGFDLGAEGVATNVATRGEEEQRG